MAKVQKETGIKPVLCWDGGIGRRNRLIKKLSAPMETLDVESP